MDFPTQIEQILKRLVSVKPSKYGATRNYKDGAVTRLSPYISRGVISTRQVYEHIKSLNIGWRKTEKLIQELAWRDYWQQVWIDKQDLIFVDLKKAQESISNYKIPKAIVEANTGIEAVDQSIQSLYETGYMHNHMRMYVASICCNIAQCHWAEPSNWLYSHLLDGDLASNNLSWQWVVGTNSNKKYYANQDNINKYFYSHQKNTFLDVTYDQFGTLPIPKELLDLTSTDLKLSLSPTDSSMLDKDRTTLIYNYYNLDPNWSKEEDVQRILLLEPSVFEKHPISEKCIDFTIKLSQNIKGIQLFVGEFEELTQVISPDNIRFKEHPLNRHYQGKEESRDWLTTVTGYYPSFFAFWKKCKRELKW